MRFGLVALLLIGCGSSAETPADLAAGADDLAVADDMAMGSDMASTDLNPAIFCAHLHAALGGAVASDCAVAYLARLMSCFQPSGACGSTPDNASPDATDSCWANGAALHRSHLLGNVSSGYATNGHRCAWIHTDTGGPHAADFCSATPAYDCHFIAGDMAGSGASYVDGIFTCTDGTQVATGNLFACDDVTKFLAPACDQSVDGGGCVFP